MTPDSITQNTLYYGDNLTILRDGIADASVDLIYLDPPFNSNRSYNVLFRDESGLEAPAQVAAFEDTWHWNSATAAVYEELVTAGPPRVAATVGALRQTLGTNQMLAYLVMMAVRLVELHRVLKPTGSLYLHCDPTASHYLKILLDAVFSARFFRNEIVWKRAASHGGPVGYNNVHDVLLYYSKTERALWNSPRAPHSERYVQSHYRNADADGRRYQLVSAHGAGDGPPRRFGDTTIAPPIGRHWMSQEHIDQMMAAGNVVFTSSGMPRYKRYLDETEGAPLGTVWDDIPPINSQAQERLGYPTQKPLALLERIVRASSNPGDVVLDPFCGCGTTIAAAQKLGRTWLGIDITHLSIALMKYRLRDMFDLEERRDYLVVGEPQDLPSAYQLAHDDRYQFQWWALSLIKARPVGGQPGSKQGKKGSDKGIDGVLNFIDESGGSPKRVIVQVKSGKVKSGDVRDLHGALEREGAALAVLVTLEPPTGDMVSEAAGCGFYHSPWWDQKYPRLQILTIEDLLNGKGIQMPPSSATFKQAQRAQAAGGKQGELL